MEKAEQQANKRSEKARKKREGIDERKEARRVKKVMKNLAKMSKKARDSATPQISIITANQDAISSANTELGAKKVMRKPNKIQKRKVVGNRVTIVRAVSPERSTTKVLGRTIQPIRHLSD